MTPQLLLQHFDRIGEAPDAIPRLRRFILDLAVRGKLVEQDPRDEPASELLKRIQVEKENLVKAGKGKQQKSLPPLTNPQVPFPIPDSWVWVRLGTLTEKITDGEHLSPKKTTNGMPLLTATHVTSHGITFNNPQFVSIEDGYKSRLRCDPRRGDVLICSRGTIGRCAVVNTDKTFCLMGSVILARFPKGTLSTYFNYFLLTDRAQRQMRGMSGSTAVQALYLKDIRLCPVPLPPLAEQHRIVAKVDELMALYDRMEAAQSERESRRDRLVASSLYHLNNGADADAFREHACFYFNHLPRLTTRPHHIKQLRQTILNLAVRGKLVPQVPSDEPAENLLKQVLVERHRKWEADQYDTFPASNKGRPKTLKKKYIAPTHETGLFALPKSWAWASALEICDRVENGSTPPASDMFHEVGEIPFIKVYNLTKTGTFDFTVKPTFVARTTHDKLLARSKIFPGDVLMNIVGPPLGKVSIIPNTFPEWNTNQAVVLFRPSSSILTGYLAICLLSEIVLFWITRTAQATVGQSNITVSNSRLLPLPLPPLGEQHRIVAKVDELMALCDQLESQLATTQSETQKLMEAILHEALTLRAEPKQAVVL